MNEYVPTPEFDKVIRQSFSVPPLRAVFAAQLRSELASRAKVVSTRRPGFKLQTSWAVAIAVVFLLIVALATIGPQRVYAAMNHWLGYLQGVGMVDQTYPIRVLVVPVSVTREGIVLTVESATLTQDKTVLTYTVENVPQSARPNDETVAGCTQSAGLTLPDGSTLTHTGGQGTATRFTEIYPAIPTDVNQARFVLPCIFETLPGKAPADWELTLHFQAAPPSFTLAPVINISNSTIQPSNPASAATGTSIASSTPTMSHGINFVLDQAIPLDDGYYLLGHSTWSDTRITAVNPVFKAYNAASQAVPLEWASFQEAGLIAQPNQWLFKLYGKVFGGPVTLRAKEITIFLTEPVSFTLDPRSYGFDGTDAQLGRSTVVDPPVSFLVLDESVQVVQLQYLQQGEMKGFALGMESKGSLLALPLNLTSPVNGGRGNSSGGSPSRDDASGQLTAYVLSDGQMTFPVTLSISGFTLSGVWETAWTPPVVTSDVTPTPVLQACLTLDGWKQALVGKPSLPGDAGGKVLIRQLSGDRYSLSVAHLDGSEVKVVVDAVINPNASLSPDGGQLAYADASGEIVVVNLQSGEKIILTTGFQDANPVWSPDGTQIAFGRVTDGSQIFVMDANGTNLRSITPVGNAQPGGWSPDSTSFLYWTQVDGPTNLIHLVNVSSGAVTDLFSVQTSGPSPVFSPDGQWIAFLDHEPGWMANGLFIAHPDGSGRRLLAQVDFLGVADPVWSPDGQWLAFDVQDNQFTGTSIPALVEVSGCQVIPMAGLPGNIEVTQYR